jgi:hypothetical protein
MQLKCSNCGALLSPPSAPDAVITCHFCGAAQKLDAPPAPVAPIAPAPPPPPPPAAPAPRIVIVRQALPTFDVEPIRIPPPTGARIAAVVIVAIVAAVGIGIAVAVSNVTASKQAEALRAALPVGSLRSLSLAQTPEAMAKLTGVKAETAGYGDLVMTVPLQGATWERLQVNWDPADPTHAKAIALYGSKPAPDDAAIRRRLETAFGRRLDKNGDMQFQGASFTYTPDSARAAGDPKDMGDKNPHWKEQADATWDALRFAVLGQDVSISAEESRDWLGRGYPLSALGAIDPSVDVDHSAAAMQAAFPAVRTRETIGLRHTVAIDHPWYGEAELTWPNEKNATLSEVSLRPPPQASNKFTSQADIDACVQAAFGAPTRRYEEDHLKATYDTDWELAGGGEIRVYEHMIVITLVSHHPPKKMPLAAFKKAITTLDACGQRKG